MSDYVYLTAEGLENLKKELIDLKTRGRKEMSKQIAEAREKGDLSENAEYDAAKEAQGMMETKIVQLEGMLGMARLITSSGDGSKVVMLSTVDLMNLTTKKQIRYQLVSEIEADLKAGRISVTSPIGKGLLGKAPGVVVEIDVPAGKLKLEIIKIS